MAEPFITEIRLVSFKFAPRRWALCNGQLLPIRQNPALFALMGTTYGGDGQNTFALPDLRGRVPIHRGPHFAQGNKGGEAYHALTTAEMPSHTHTAYGTNDSATLNSPAGNLLARSTTPVYADLEGVQPMDSRTVGAAGGSKPHENRQPYLVVNFVIALEGNFPSRT